MGKQSQSRRAPWYKTPSRVDPRYDARRGRATAPHTVPRDRSPRAASERNDARVFTARVDPRARRDARRTRPRTRARGDRRFKRDEPAGVVGATLARGVGGVRRAVVAEGVRGGERERRRSSVGATGGGALDVARARANGSRATRDFETVFKRSNSEDSGGRARRREVGDARG